MYVARYHLHHGGGDLVLARQYLEFVATSNAEEVNQANELLRRYFQTPAMRQARAASEGTTAAGGSVA